MATKPRSSRGRVTPSSGPTHGERSERSERPDQEDARRTVTVNLPFVTAQVRTPQVRLPGRDHLDTAVRNVRSMLPSPPALLFYGGLAVTAALGVIEWPVAAAIGVGSALASRGAAASPQRDADGEAPAADTEASATASRG